jgi:hypothetical protein
MKMNKTIYYCFFVAGSCAAWFGTKLVVAEALAPVPLTIVYSHSSGDGTVSPSFASSSEFLVRGDGSRTEKRSLKAPDGRMYVQKTMMDVRNQREVSDGITESLTTYALTADDTKALTNPGTRCSALKNAKESTYLEYRTSTVDETFGDRRVESSYAPDLGCVLLRQTVSQTSGGQERLLSVKQASSVRLGEPAPEEFDVPSWQERSPSAVIAAFERKYQRKNSDPSIYLAKDKAYYARQVK